VGIAFFRDAIADEGEPRRTKGDQFMGIDIEIASGLASDPASEAPYFMKFPAIQ